MSKLSVLVTALVLAGQSWAAAGQPAPRRPASAAAGVPKLGDSQIESAIRAKFAKSKINADHFTVRVQDGIAIVEGKTDVIQHKGVATRMCKTAGARAVDNRIQISEAARKKAAGNLDRARRVEVKRK